jgi:tetratricopeptide (TPR) repeat protein
MTIGGPISEDSSAFDKPWLKVLREMDQLYFREGKLSQAIQVAEKKLAQVPRKDWEDWRTVYYRYWELLADAGSTLSLKTATQSYLQALPEDPFANYYAAHAFLATVEPMRSFTRDMRQKFRLEAETLAQQIERAAKAIKARQKAEGTTGKKALLQNLYQKLRLQQARLFVLIWRLGGYREDKHPDVVYRDKALDILDRDALVNLKEAKMLKISVYNHILDRWHWFEGRQVIQGLKQKRKAMVAELQKLQNELKDAEAL